MTRRPYHSRLGFRRGARALAAAGLLAGAFGTGAGVAGAQGSSWYQVDNGASPQVQINGSTPAADEAAQLLLGRCPDITFPLFEFVPCWSPWVHQRRDIGDFGVDYSSWTVVSPQEEAVFLVSVYPNNDGSPRTVTSVTHQPPKGFEFIRAEANEVGSLPSLGWSATEDPTTGAVTLTPPPEGWTVGEGDYFTFTFTYNTGLATIRGADGDHGASITGSGVEPSSDHQLTGNTRVVPGGADSGSSGS